jgi:hypothetical protein
VNLLLDTGVLGVLCHPKLALAARAESRLEQIATRIGDDLRIHLPEMVAPLPPRTFQKNFNGVVGAV